MTHRTAVIVLTAALLVTAPHAADASNSDNGDGGHGALSTSPGWDSAAKHAVDLDRRGSRVQLDVPVPGWCGSRTGTPESLPLVCRW